MLRFASARAAACASSVDWYTPGNVPCETARYELFGSIFQAECEATQGPPVGPEACGNIV